MSQEIHSAQVVREIQKAEHYLTKRGVHSFSMGWALATVFLLALIKTAGAAEIPGSAGTHGAFETRGVVEAPLRGIF